MSTSLELSPHWAPWGDEHDETALAVTALLVVQHARADWLEQTLQALVELTTRPARLVLIDATPDHRVRGLIAPRKPLHDIYPTVSVVTVPAHAPFAAIIDTAVDALPRPGEDAVVARRVRSRAHERDVRTGDKREWFWLLREDSAPDPDALDALVQVVSRSERIGIAGTKVVQLDDDRRLVNVGLDVTRTGRHVGSAMRGQADQGQYDDRRDVLAVASSGMLIRRDVYLALGGFDPAFDGDGDGLDLCWRTHLSGSQVVVVPRARVRQDPAVGTTQARRTLRRHRQVALARCSWLAMPLIAVWTTVSSLLLGLLLLLVKRPRHAAAELAAATAPLGARRILGARWRFRRRRRTRHRHLDALFVPYAAATHHAWDALREAVSRQPTPEDHTDDPAWLRRTTRHAGLWMTLVLVVAAGFWWRRLLTSEALRGTGQGLTGGQLRPFDTDSAGVWRLWRDQWAGPGLGVHLPESPYLPVLSGLSRLVELLPWVEDSTAAATTVAWLLVLAMPLSGISAYLAGRAATQAPWPRAFAGLVWASLATLTAGVAAGRLGPVVAHVLLPLAVAGAFTVARRTASSPATFGTVLVTAVLGAFAPVLLVPVSLIGLGVLAFGRGWARLRGLIVAAGPWLLLGPWTFERLRVDSRALLAGPGALDSGTPARPWQLALLHPGGPSSYLALLSLPVLVLGVAGLVRRRQGYGGALAGLAVLALLGLAGGLAAGHVLLTDGSGAPPRSPWPGPALDLVAAAALGAALLAGGDLFSRAGLAGSGQRARVVLAAGLVIAVGWAATVIGLVAWRAQVSELTAAPERMPAVARQLSLGERATRMLTLTVEPDGAVAYQLQGAETGPPARDLDVPQRTSPQVARAVAGLLSPGGASAVREAHRQLAELGVAFVGVTGVGDRAGVTRQLQGTDGLSPMASNQALSLWRVSDSPSRVRLGAEPVDARGPHARTTTRLTSGGQLVVSEAAGWAGPARVTLDGAPLTATPGATYPTYQVPPTGGLLRIDLGLTSPTWRWVQGALALAMIFLAIPFGNARSRRHG